MYLIIITVMRRRTVGIPDGLSYGHTNVTTFIVDCSFGSAEWLSRPYSPGSTFSSRVLLLGYEEQPACSEDTVQGHHNHHERNCGLTAA